MKNAEKFVECEVYANANELMDMIMKHDIDSVMDCIPYDSDNETYVDVYEWWVVSNTFKACLKAVDIEQVFYNVGDVIIWGRTVTGQKISMDPVVKEGAEIYIERC